MERSSRGSRSIFACLLAPFLLSMVGSAPVWAGPDGSWLPGPGAPGHLGRPPGRQWHCAAIDPIRRRLFIVGGNPGAMGDLWMLDLQVSPPAWHRLAGPSPGPGDRMASALAYDTARDRLLLMGGSNPSGSQYFSDVWEYPLGGGGWRLVPVPGPGPAERSWHGAVYDVRRDRLVVVGGQTRAIYLDDAWALPLSGPGAWIRLGTAGPPPEARAKCTVVYDSTRDEIVRFGGQNSFNFYNDTWTLSLADDGVWGRLTTSGTGPGVRAGAAGVFDPRRNCMVIYGGASVSGETYALDLSGPPTWRKESVVNLPGRREYPAAVLDVAVDRMLLFGGCSGSGWPADLMAWDLAGRAWSEQQTVGTPEHPYVRADQTVALDRTTHELFMVGGYSEDTGEGRNDVWRMDLLQAPTWTRLFPGGSALPGRQGCPAVIDEVGQQLILVGGARFASRDVWAMHLSGAGSWTQLFTSGPQPPAEEERGAVYDPIRRRVLLTGFRSTGGWDVWALPLDGTLSWIDLTSIAPSPVVPLWGNSSVYDAEGDQLVLLGGDPNSEVWALGLAGTPTWRRLYAGPGPSVRYEHAVTFDTRRRRILLSGGNGVGGVYLPDTWEFDLGAAAWRQLAPTGAKPMPRGFHSINYDHDNDRLVLFGGHNGQYLGDTWYLQFDEPTPVRVTVVRANAGVDRARILWRVADSRSYSVERRGPGSDWREIARRTPDGSELIDFEDAGLASGGEYGYRLAWGESGLTRHGGETSILVSQVTRFELREVGAAPNGATATVEFAIPTALPVAIGVFDVQGRRLWQRSYDDLAAGEHRIEVPCAAMNPGLYYLRIEQQGAQLAARFAIVR